MNRQLRRSPSDFLNMLFYNQETSQELFADRDCFPGVLINEAGG
jgi:hypothetical protein